MMFSEFLERIHPLNKRSVKYFELIYDLPKSSSAHFSGTYQFDPVSYVSLFQIKIAPLTTVRS